MEEIDADHDSRPRTMPDAPEQPVSSTGGHVDVKPVQSPGSQLSPKYKKNFKASWIRSPRVATPGKEGESSSFKPRLSQDTRDSLPSSPGSVPTKTERTPSNSSLSVPLDSASTYGGSDVTVSKQNEDGVDQPTHATPYKPIPPELRDAHGSGESQAAIANTPISQESGNKSSKARRLKQLFTASGSKKIPPDSPTSGPRAPTTPTPSWRFWDKLKLEPQKAPNTARRTQRPPSPVAPMAPNRTREIQMRDPGSLPRRMPDGTPSPVESYRYRGKQRGSTGTPSSFGGPLRRGVYTQSPQSILSYDSGDVLAKAPSFRATYSPVVVEARAPPQG